MGPGDGLGVDINWEEEEEQNRIEDKAEQSSNYPTSFRSPSVSLSELRTKPDHFSIWNCGSCLFCVFRNMHHHQTLQNMRVCDPVATWY